MGRKDVDDKGSDGSLDETLPSNDPEQPIDRERITRATSSPPSSEPVIERGALVGRYTVLDRLGSGTMGLVMSAFDATLDRKIALKLVRPDHSGSSIGRQRLLREAQAMARLSHPNVVTVFEVGEFGEHVFLAMEYVATTLAEWLAKAPRTRREIVDAFADAGHGLAAAHRAGIVHRDFKPTNVLVSAEGRVLVADFGLATASTERATTPPLGTAVDEPLTMTATGAVLGTPAYMSPEQHGSRVADARADQFSFCVALYEALYRELPFDGKDYLAYSENVLEGRVREAPRNSDVPVRIRKVLLRGLSLAADDRYPSMDSLLADLARDPAAGRRRVALGAGVVVAAVAIGGLWIRGNADRDDDPCALAEQPLAGLWDAAAKRALEQSFATSKVPGAPAAFERVAKVLDQRAPLREVRRDACVATAVKHDQSPDLLDRRIQCVDQRASELAALIAVLTEAPDAKTIDKSVEAVISLPSIAGCSDRTALLAKIPPPNSPELRVRVGDVDRHLDRADALLSAGKYADAVAETTRVAPTADGIDYVPIRARAHFLDATAQLELGHFEQAAAELRKTAELAAAAHDDLLLARTWIQLYVVIGFRLRRFDEARGLESTAAAAVTRAGNSLELRGYLDNARGAVELGQSNYAAAAERFLASAQELSQAIGPNTPRVASSLANAGHALEGAGRHAEARAALEHALAVRIELLGPEHPTVAVNHYQLGTLLDAMGQPDKALIEFQAAIAIDSKSLPDSQRLATDLVSAGVVLNQLGQSQQALVHQERALAILRLHSDDNKIAIITAMQDLAGTYRRLGRVSDAIRMFHEVIELAEATLGPGDPSVARILSNLALTLSEAGDGARAQKLWARAVSILEAKFGADHAEVGKMLGVLVEHAHDRHDYRETLRLANRAIAIFEQPKYSSDPFVFGLLLMRGDALYETKSYSAAVADLTRARDGYLQTAQLKAATRARTWLADALWEAKRHGDAIAEVRAALAAYEAEAKPDPKQLAGARDWLAKHPAPRR